MSVVGLDLQPLRQAHARLAELSVVPEAAVNMRANARDAVAALRGEVLREVRGFSESGNPRVLPELGEHAGAHVAELLRLFAGEQPGDFAFVRDHARLRAEQRF